MLCSERKKSRDSTEMQEIKQQQKRLNINLTRSEGNGAPEEKAKEVELFSVKEKDWERCETIPI